MKYAQPTRKKPLWLSLNHPYRLFLMLHTDNQQPSGFYCLS
ncbi:hypothetical protein yberc0001_28460 [Yersinia bercovieri ATCC 43970]|uniref:Uncharacterized protein n=1 Tax=Yersinia bercovieri ATCC 43970 TaxID=349968 RepID=A0ABM9XWV1_YERBE|nr:hypothetical protein yberc0001_28460 [Yersinia bercovieri ATCC 43970]